MGLSDEVALKCLFKFDDDLINAAPAGGDPATLFGTPILGDGGLYGAGKFDQAINRNADGRVDIASFPAIETIVYTVASYIWLDSHPTETNNICGKFVAPSVSHAWMWYLLATGRIEFSTKGAAVNYFQTADPIPLGEWVHIAMTCNGTEAKGYVNGVQTTVTQDVTGNVYTDQEPVYLNVGMHIPVKYDDFRIYDRVLSEAEIFELAFNPYLGPPTGLLATPASPSRINLTWTDPV